MKHFIGSFVFKLNVALFWHLVTRSTSYSSSSDYFVTDKD